MSRPIESLHNIIHKYVEETKKFKSPEYTFNQTQKELACLLIQIVFTYHPDAPEPPEPRGYYEIVLNLIYGLSYLSEDFCRELEKVCAVGEKISGQIHTTVLNMVKGAIIQNNLELLEIARNALRHQLHIEELDRKLTAKPEKLEDVVQRVSIRLN